MNVAHNDKSGRMVFVPLLVLTGLLDVPLGSGPLEVTLLLEIPVLLGRPGVGWAGDIPPAKTTAMPGEGTLIVQPFVQSIWELGGAQEAFTATNSPSPTPAYVCPPHAMFSISDRLSPLRYFTVTALLVLDGNVLAGTVKETVALVEEVVLA